MDLDMDREEEELLLIKIRMVDNGFMLLEILRMYYLTVRNILMDKEILQKLVNNFGGEFIR